MDKFRICSEVEPAGLADKLGLRTEKGSRSTLSNANNSGVKWGRDLIPKHCRNIVERR